MKSLPMLSLTELPTIKTPPQLSSLNDHSGMRLFI